jgi:hypothetical protein
LIQAIPWWAQKAPEAWELAAELKWCNEAWKVKSREAKARRRKMGGASHRQGSCSHTHWKKKVVGEIAYVAAAIMTSMFCVQTEFKFMFSEEICSFFWNIGEGEAEACLRC